MNKCSLIGRLTKDPEVKQTPNNILVCSFTLAVDRRFKDQGGNKQTDFIPCVGWRKVAELLGNYCHKGSKIGITGSIQTRSYDGQNGKVYVTEVLAEEIEFLDSKTQEQQTQTPPPAPQDYIDYDARAVQEVDEETLPFDIYGY